jgi:hypothetical protein
MSEFTDAWTPAVVCKHPQIKSIPIMAHVHDLNRLVPQTVEGARFMSAWVSPILCDW